MGILASTAKVTVVYFFMLPIVLIRVIYLLFCFSFRTEPPTEEEIAKNVAIADLKKINAAKIEEKRLTDGGSLPTPVERGAQSFPTYSEYHTGDPSVNPKNKGN